MDKIDSIFFTLNALLITKDDTLIGQADTKNCARYPQSSVLWPVLTVNQYNCETAPHDHDEHVHAWADYEMFAYCTQCENCGQREPECYCEWQCSGEDNIVYL